METSNKRGDEIDQETLAQYNAVRKQAGLFDLSDRGKIKVTGSDRASFLNNILTNDIKALRPGQGCYAMLLNAQAKIIAEMHVLIFSGHVLLDVESGYAEKTMERIDKLLIADDARLEIKGRELSHFSVQGPRSDELLAKLFSNVAQLTSNYNHSDFELDGQTFTVIRRDRFGKGFDIILSQNHGQAFRKKMLAAGKDLGLREVGKRAAEILRIEHGILRFGVDFTEETMLPETGLEKIAASETKGCYPGQEVVAKIITYNGLNRKISGLIYRKSEPVQNDSVIFAKGKEVGFTTSACYSPFLDKGIAFGVLKKGFFDPGHSVKIKSFGNEIPAETSYLPG